MIRALVSLLAALAVAIVVALGLWVSGGSITNDFGVAMWLSVGWMVVTGVAVLAVARRSRVLRWPLLVGYATSAVAAGLYLGPSAFFDTRVDEDVAEAAPMAHPRKGGAAPANRGSAAHGRPATNVALRAGRFEPVRHAAHGDATFIRLAEGGRVVTLTNFEVENGPDLRVYLVAGPSTTEEQVTDYVDLGGLKGNIGDQQYEVPRGVDISRYATVVVWCRAFSVLFARAPTVA